ncbi:hypothetical protein EKK58_06360 [Candidatus Dependentiae bacterium]|nr:MAG: hypothetical protein EKK58_06360 [Candidatus Dependentiae bacterium]
MIHLKNLFKKMYVFLLLMLISNSFFANVFIDDRILSLIYDEEEPILITKKDLEKPNILGRPHTLESLKLNGLICADARKLKVLIPEDAIERMVEQILKQNNLSLEQFLELLKAEGHTLDTYREALKEMQLINSMLDFRVYSRATVSYEAIVTYYNNHPVIKEEMYQLQTCFVPFEHTMSRNKQKEHITKQLKENALPLTDPFWIKSSDIDPAKSFIKSMKINKPVIQEEQNGFRIYVTVAEQKAMPVPLVERYEEIVKILKEPLEKELLQKYQEELLKNAVIVDF